MVTKDFLFDKKIIWLGDDSICADNFSNFKDEFITLSEIMGFNNHTLAQIELELDKSEHYGTYYLLYLRFSKNGINFYAGDDSDLEDAMQVYRDYINNGYKPLKWSDLVGDEIDLDKIFRDLNESEEPDSFLYRKKIWFDQSAERKDIEDVYDFLVGNGIDFRDFEGYHYHKDEYLDELDDFIYNHGIGYFYITKSDSPLFSEKEKKPYIDYGYLDHTSPEELREKPNWIYYKDIVEDNTNFF